MQSAARAMSPACNAVMNSFTISVLLKSRFSLYRSGMIPMWKVSIYYVQGGDDGYAEERSEILFIQAVRDYMRTAHNGNGGWFNALKDPQIGQALALIQHQPGESWSVESLASRVSLSRSAFSAKFKELVGESPMQYVTRVRLTKAAAMLRTRPSTL